jgi:hypothetical protein
VANNRWPEWRCNYYKGQDSVKHKSGYQGKNAVMDKQVSDPDGGLGEQAGGQSIEKVQGLDTTSFRYV